MTKKDYELIANALRSQIDYWQCPKTQYGIKQAALQIALACRSENPRFNRDKFLAACGVTQNDK